MRRSGKPSPLTSPNDTESGWLPVAKVCWGAKEGAEAPGAVVFSRTDAVSLPLLAVTRSGKPSPLTSPSATAKGSLPVAKVCWGAKEGVVAPGAVVLSSVVFSSTPTFLSEELATRRSGLPSPLTSPNAAEKGLLPVAKVCWAAKEDVADPGAVVFSSTPTVPSPSLATRRSGLPSPLTSPTATETGFPPVAKVCWGAKEGAVAPGAVVFSSTDTLALP